jgi:hypothetical protein
MKRTIYSNVRAFVFAPAFNPPFATGLSHGSKWINGFLGHQGASVRDLFVYAFAGAEHE